MSGAMGLSVGKGSDMTHHECVMGGELLYTTCIIQIWFFTMVSIGDCPNVSRHSLPCAELSAPVGNVDVPCHGNVESTLFSPTTDRWLSIPPRFYLQ